MSSEVILAIEKVRNDNAFDGTDVVPRAQVDAGVLRILDSGQWLAQQ